ncbi:MAG TPA: hypothetical protein VEC19_04870 [Usitatibacter sp.]|nr:hypothetical protein [Usitatibacter sp.]
MAKEGVSGPYLGERLSRRRFLRVAAAGASGLLLPLEAFGDDQVHDLRGRVSINGVPATTKSAVRPGDRIVTGSDGHFVFVMAKSDAVMVRSRSELVIERYEEQGLLRLVTGAIGAVFARGRPRRILAANVTAGIRGTGVYLETRGDGTYFCTCWGVVELASAQDPREREVITSTRHVPRLVSLQPRDGSRFLPAPFETHTDEEMDILMKCVGLRSPIVVPGGDQEK